MNMVCKDCNTENREYAKFCKYCGAPLPIAASEALDKLVGLSEVKMQIQNIVEMYTSLRLRSEAKEIRSSLNILIIGETGTGKTLMPKVLKDVLYANRVIEAPLLRIVDAVDYGKFVENWDRNIKEIQGGILFIDNAQKLLPNIYSKEVNQLNKLFYEMSKWDNDPVVVLAGLPGELEKLFKNNDAARNHFNYLFRLLPYSYEELRDMTVNQMNERFGGLQFSPEAYEKLTIQLKYEVKTKDDSFGNGHHACQKAENIFRTYTSHQSLTPGVIQSEDILGYIPPFKSLNDILTELDEIIGMREIKKIVRDIAFEIQDNIESKKRSIGKKGSKPSIHFILTGNHGAGKATLARKLGEIFEAISFLDSGHLVKVDKSRMISQYIGEIPQLVDKLVDKAMGGILYIDEAHTLASTNSSGTKDEPGTLALEKLMTRMDDAPGAFVVIAAGYKTEIENLLRINPEMKSRFNCLLEIEDYSLDELFQILESFVHKRKCKMDEEAKEYAKKAIKQIYDERDKNFANGREIRTLFEKMNALHSERISKLSLNKQTNEELTTFRRVDIPYHG